MYDSEITAEQLIKELKDEIDASVEIPLSTYVRWLNSLERFLYRVVVKERETTEINLDYELETDETGAYGDGYFKPVDLPGIKFRDIKAVYYHCRDGEYPDTYYPSGVELIKVGKGSENLLDNCYYDDGGGKLGICMDDALKEYGAAAYLSIASIRLPEIKTYDTETKIISGDVNIPYEFIDMVCAKLRYEAYMMCEEPQVAANWLGVFNARLEDFKVWHDMQSRIYGG